MLGIVGRGKVGGITQCPLSAPCVHHRGNGTLVVAKDRNEAGQPQGAFFPCHAATRGHGQIGCRHQLGHIGGLNMQCRRGEGCEAFLEHAKFWKTLANDNINLFSTLGGLFNTGDDFADFISRVATPHEDQQPLQLRRLAPSQAGGPQHTEFRP